MNCWSTPQIKLPKIDIKQKTQSTTQKDNPSRSGNQSQKNQKIFVLWPWQNTFYLIKNSVFTNAFLVGSFKFYEIIVAQRITKKIEDFKNNIDLTFPIPRQGQIDN